MFMRLSDLGGQCVDLRRLVCAQHGCSPEGVQVPRVRTMKNKTLAEANCGRVTDRGEEG